MSRDRYSSAARRRASSPRILWRRSTLTVSDGSRPWAMGQRRCPSVDQGQGPDGLGWLCSGAGPASTGSSHRPARCPSLGHPRARLGLAGHLHALTGPRGSVLLMLYPWGWCLKNTEEHWRVRVLDSGSWVGIVVPY